MIARLSPTARVLLSFLALIAMGTFLLWLPITVRAPYGPLSFVDALFISTSAVCVTGLSPVAVGQQFSLFGQAVLLLLIQLGGLGFLTLSTGLLLTLGGRSSLLNRDAMTQTWGGRNTAEHRQVLRSVFLMTFSLEAIGAAVLAWRMGVHDQVGWLQALWLGVFHSVSAFCNAGFSLYADSLMSYRGDPVVNLMVMVLIIFGGLGFLVVADVFRKWRTGRKGRLGLQTKIVLVTSAVLTAGGAVLSYFFECDNAGTLAPMGHGERVLASLFQSVTARTAGFNSLDFAQFHGATLVMYLVLMFIGGSPASCAGGVKTTTAFLIFQLTVTRLIGRRHPTAFGREISAESVNRAATLILVFFACAAVLVGTLMIAEAERLKGHAYSGLFMDLLFEAVSALGTVGLSTGVTAELSPASKLALVLGMYIGRLGPLSIFIRLAEPPHRDRVRYPEEPVMVG